MQSSLQYLHRIYKLACWLVYLCNNNAFIYIEFKRSYGKLKYRRLWWYGSQTVTLHDPITDKGHPEHEEVSKRANAKQPGDDI